MSIHLSCGFDAGAIEVVSIQPRAALESDAPSADIRLRLRADNAADFRQWFYFRLQGAAGVRCVMHIENASLAAYPGGWPDYQAVASVDREHWFRLPQTRYENGTLIITWTPPADSVYLAYFQPYSQERHLDLLARVGTHPAVLVTRLGSSVQGRDIDLVTVGTSAPEKKRLWVVARQHPGETMAEWFAEGLIERLLDASCPVAQRLREQAVFHVVPNINPDGSVLGNLRTNAAGANLNREWLHPTQDRSPEVLCVRDAMHRIGVDFFLDVHGDETLPYVFIDGSHMLPGRSPANLDREARFLAAVSRACPDFQTTHGYASNRFDDELYTLASKYVGHTFDCLSVTLEMPFKDNTHHPDPTCGWNGARSKTLGRQMLDAIAADLALNV